MKGNKALLFGATGGLGRSLIKELQKEGVQIYVIGRSRRKLDALGSEFSLDAGHLFHVDSITAQPEHEKTRQWLTDLNVSFHYWIHSAGEGLMKPACKLSLSQWTSLIDINLTSAFAFYKLCSAFHFPQQYELVYFSSASLNQAWPKNSLYGASKAGLEAFASALQQEIKSDGGRVWLYRAGSIHTGFFNRVKSHVPVEKMLSAAEVANVVVTNLNLPQGMYFPLIPILNQ